MSISYVLSSYYNSFPPKASHLPIPIHEIRAYLYYYLNFLRYSFTAHTINHQTVYIRTKLHNQLEQHEWEQPQQQQVLRTDWEEAQASTWLKIQHSRLSTEEIQKTAYSLSSLLALSSPSLTFSRSSSSFPVFPSLPIHIPISIPI